MAAVDSSAGVDGTAPRGLGDYGGPLFLLPGLVIVWEVTGRPTGMISPPQQAAMAHYLRQAPAAGAAAIVAAL